MSEFRDLVPRFLELDKTSVGVYRFQNRFFAYENICPHQGGPVCEGIASGRTEARISPTGKYLEDYVSSKVVIACPWHGSEYDIESGFFHDKLKLRSFPVRIEGEQVMVDLDLL